MPTAGLILLGGITPVPVHVSSVEGFNFGTVAVESVEPFYLQQANISLTSVEPFNLVGYATKSIAEPFAFGQYTRVSSVEPFNLTDSSSGMYAPSGSPVVTVFAASGSSTVTVDQTTGVTPGMVVSLNGQLLTVLSTTLTTITFTAPIAIDANIGTIVAMEGSSIAAPLYGWWTVDADIDLFADIQSME